MARFCFFVYGSFKEFVAISEFYALYHNKSGFTSEKVFDSDVPIYKTNTVRLSKSGFTSEGERMKIIREIIPH